MINYYVYADGENIENIDSILFDFNTIKVATNNFSSINKLGEGGFGPVYKVLLFIGHTYGCPSISNDIKYLWILFEPMLKILLLIILLFAG